MESHSLDESDFNVTEVIPVNCYEEKKLLIQNAELRCHNLENQLDYIQTLWTHFNYTGLQDQVLRDYDNNSINNWNWDAFTVSEEVCTADKNQHLYTRSIPRKSGINLGNACFKNFILGKSLTPEAHVNDPGELSKFEEMHTPIKDKCVFEKLNKKINPKQVIEKDEPDKLLHKRPTEGLSESLNNKRSSHKTVNIGNEYLSKNIENSLKNTQISQECDMKNTDNGSRCCNSFKLRACEGESKFEVGGKKGWKVQEMKKEGKYVEEDTTEDIRKMIFEMTKRESVNAENMLKSKEGKIKVVLEASMLRGDSKMPIHEKNTNNNINPPLHRTAVLSVTTLPASNFRSLKDNAHFSEDETTIKAKKLCKKMENSCISQCKVTKKNYLPKHSENTKCGPHTVDCDMVTDSFIKNAAENVDQQMKKNEHQEQNLPNKRYMTTMKSTLNRSESTKCKPGLTDDKTWRHAKSMPQHAFTQHTKTYADDETDPISVSFMAKESKFANQGRKSKQRQRSFCLENVQKAEGKKSKFWKKLELCSTSSKLKMSEKLQRQGSCFKYPFVVGKATTPSHNIVLNIQNTLSIIKMQPSVISSQYVSSAMKESQHFSSPITADVRTRSMLGMGAIIFSQAHSSLSWFQRCPLLIQGNSSAHITQDKYQDWNLLQEKYEDVKCQCYPRNCTDYHKILNQFLEGGEEIRFLKKQISMHSCSPPKKFHQNTSAHGETTRVRLSQVLHQVQRFQDLLNGRFAAAREH